jgi:hypothetical protein
MTTASHDKPGFFSQMFAPPPRLAALLPDGRFFLRLVPVEPEGDAASVAEQVALALETLAPFPIAQLYHGHYWQPGSPRALVYAVYRKRFPAEETVAWAEAQVVLPGFTILLADPPVAGTVRVLTSPDAVTVFHWGDDALVPTQALIQPFGPGSTDADRAAAREQLVRSLGLGAEAAVEDWDYPALHRVTDGGEITFLTGGREVVVPADLASALDVRDYEEIAERRRNQQRDILLWRVFLGMASLILLCVVAEGALFYGHKVIEKRTTLILTDKPKVAALQAIVSSTEQTSQALSRSLHPLEMLALVVHGQLPDTSQITRATGSINGKDNSTTLQLIATTSDNTDARKLVNALTRLPECQSAELTSPATPVNARGGLAADTAPSYTYTINVTFKPNAITPASSSSAAAVAAAPAE